MLKTLTQSTIIFFVATFNVAGAAGQASSKPQLALAPCEVEGLKGGGKCGTLEVYENRAAKKGRRIKLNILVLPATGQKHEPDPLVYFAGGPGAAATEDASGIAELFEGIREHRDLLFVDQRGTGKSHALVCELYNPEDPQSYLGYFFPLDAVHKCREQLEPNADLTLYTTDIAADDMDDIRAALGYEKLNLYGGSYGTRAALVYLRRHPKHVRSVILQGVAPTNFFIPRNFARDTERALQGVLSECEADEACNKAFPQVKVDQQSVLEQLLQSPAEAEVPPLPNSKDRVTVRVNRNLVAEAVRYLLYNPGSASRVPLFLHLAAHGNYAPLAEAALRYRQFLVGRGNNGMYLSVTCAEDLPWIKEGEAEQLATSTFLGNYRVDQQREACELWPRATIDSKFFLPVRSTVPVLMFTGEWDPATPPSNAADAAKTLPNSLQVVVPHGGHGFNGLEGLNCILRLATEFVEHGTVKGLDTACLKNIRRRGFLLKL